MSVDPKEIPPWIHKANRRRRLLSLGVSLDEQRNYSIRELDELIAVDEIFQEAAKDEQDRQARQARSGGRR